MSSLGKLMLATLEGMGMLPPPYAMMAGKGPLPDGYVIAQVKEIDFPLSETLTVSVFPEIDPVTDDGFGGLTPSSFVWRS